MVARHEREERSSPVIETSNDAYVAMDLAGDIVDWNEQAERLFGWRRHEVLGRPLGHTIVPPAFREAHKAGIERFGATGEGPLVGQRAELSALHRRGHEFPVELTLWATGSGDHIRFHVFLHDITQRRKDEEARRLLASIVDSSNDAVIAQDCAGNILSWNEGAERMFGYPAEEAVGQPGSLIVPPDHHDDVISPLRDATGDVIGRSTIARDITEQRWLAGALDDTVEALAKATDGAGQAEAVTRQFLADAAHQIRSPIARIRGCAEALLRGPPTEERDRLLAHIVRETSRAGRLVTSLLTMARLDQGMTLVPQRCDLVALCTDEVERAGELAPHLELTVTANRSPDTGPALDADAVREILANLLDNARRHGRRHIEVTVGGKDDMVEIRVSDDGPGLADELVERAFERFASLDGKGGSGLGLPIARGLARAQGGDLTYEDRAFLLRLPVLIDKDSKLVASGSEPQARPTTKRPWPPDETEPSGGVADDRGLRFLADAAHQLRSPITGLQACAQALLLSPADAERDRLLANLVRETARAGRVIASLLRLARLDEGQPVTLEPCDLVALCADEADRTWTLAPQLDVALRAEGMSADQPRLDAEAVREILANLLDNARRHAAGSIEVLIGGTDEGIEIRVVDDGPGLSENLRERAFERFVSVDEHGGAGLGLPIARGLARAQGGDVTYEGGGFLLWLPALEAVDDASGVGP